MSSPSFYAIIPAHVRYCKDIEMGAKLLYAEITSLTHAAGYCWATNQYFAELYDVDSRTIQRWLTSLKDAKFIIVEVTKNGINSQRKIWVSPEIKEMFTERQICHPPMTKMSPPHDKNAVHNSKSNTKENINNTPPTPKKTNEQNRGKSVSVSSSSLKEYGKHVQLEEKDYNDFVSKKGKLFIDDLIEQINDYIESKHGGKSPYSKYDATIRTWIRRREEDEKKQSNSNKKFTKENPAARHYGLSKGKQEGPVEFNGSIFDPVTGTWTKKS